MTGPESRYGFTVGDRVRVLEETDHPEDPIGTVVAFLDGGVVVLFPLAAHEIWRSSELRRVEPGDDR